MNDFPSTRIEIKTWLSLSTDEVRFAFARAGGPGGQDIDKLTSC